jgi:hypothetical protein
MGILKCIFFHSLTNSWFEFACAYSLEATLGAAKFSNEGAGTGISLSKIRHGWGG